MKVEQVSNLNTGIFCRPLVQHSGILAFIDCNLEDSCLFFIKLGISQAPN